MEVYMGDTSQFVFDDCFCRELIRAKKNTLMLTIYQVLLLHRGPILKFTLSISGLKSCPEIDQLILFVSNNGIQEFTLHIWKGKPYKLPSALYSCLQLKCLNLRSCLFKPPPRFIGFKRLLSLELNEVSITAEILSNLVSGCPLLEELTLKSSTTFHFLEIAAPNLRTLYCESLLGSICLKNAPRLAEVSIYLKDFRNRVLFNEGEIYDSSILLGSIPAVEFMELDYYYAKCVAADGVPTRLPTTLNHLENIMLYDICFGELDKAFPSETVDLDPVLELLDVPGEWSDVSLNQLRKVGMQRISGSNPELGFIKFLLAKSPMLERMLIELPRMTTDENRFLKELTRFDPHRL